jgi:hypothetical protein
MAFRRLLGRFLGIVDGRIDHVEDAERTIEVVSILIAGVEALRTGQAAQVPDV